MLKHIFTTSACLLFLASIANAKDDPVFSGPQEGEKLPALKVRLAYGENAGKDIDLVEAAGEKPLLLVFVQQRTRPAFALSRSMMEYATKRKADGLESGLIFLDDDATAMEQWLGTVKPYLSTSGTVAMSLDGKEGPGSYGLNRDVMMTVLVAKEGRVTANFALIDPSVQADGPRIGEAIVKLIGGDPPKAEDLAAMQRPARTTTRAPATDQPADNLIRGLLGPVIAKQASEEEVIKAAKKVEDYAAEHAEFARQVGDRAKRIVDSGRLEQYGTAKAQEYLRKWAEQWAGGQKDK